MNGVKSLQIPVCQFPGLAVIRADCAAPMTGAIFQLPEEPRRVERIPDWIHHV